MQRSSFGLDCIIRWIQQHKTPRLFLLQCTVMAIALEVSQNASYFSIYFHFIASSLPVHCEECSHIAKMQTKLFSL